MAVHPVAPDHAAVRVEAPPAGAAGDTPSTAEKDRAGARYLPALDGLRTVSVAAVVSFHLGYLRGGFLGVDVFFAISGFLITRLLLEEVDRTGGIALRRFWGRRFRRLVPALLVVLVAVAVASRSWLEAWRLPELRNDGFGALAYVANWRFSLSGQSYFQQGIGPSPLRHTWSLAIEEQFYLVWPLLVLAAVVAVRARGGRSVHRAVAVVAGSGTILSAVWMAQAATAGDDLSRVYYGTDTRAFTLCAGAWLATWLPAWLGSDRSCPAHRARARYLSFATLPALVGLAALAVVASEDASSSYRYAFQGAAVLSVVAIAGVVTRHGPASRALGAAPMRWLGRRSYGIYLWSWPIQVLVGERYALVGLRLAAVVTFGSVALAALSFTLVEEPVRTGRWSLPGRPSAAPRVRRRPALGYTGGGVAVALVVALVSVNAAGAPAAPGSFQISDDEAVAVALRPAETPVRDAWSADGSAFRAPLATPGTQAGPSPSESTGGPDEGPAGEDPTVDDGAPFGPRTPTLVRPEATGDPAAVNGRPLRVLVTGDSVAWSLVGKMRPEDRPGSLTLDNRAIIGCGLMPPDSLWDSASRAPEPYFDACQKRDAADDLGIAGRPDVVLLWMGAWEVYDHDYQGEHYEVGTDRMAELLEARLQERLDRYRAAGLTTVVGLVPCFGPSPAAFGTEREDPDRVMWVNQRIRAVARRNHGWVRTIDPTATLCDHGTARSLPDGAPIRTDGAHFDEASAPWFWNTWLAGQLAAALQP